MNNKNTIDNIYNSCLDEILQGRSTLEDCLKRYPDHAAELEGLLMTSLDISKAAKIDPAAGAKMRVRVALNERMAELSGRQPSSRPFWRVGWANAVITFVLGVSMAGGSVAYAASSAMPGQALYPLKLDLEQALVSVTFSSDAKVQLYAALNDRRVGEIVYLAQKGDSQGIAVVTSRIEGNLSAAAVVKGISAKDFAAAKAATPANPSFTTNITGADTASPGVTPPTGIGSAGGGTTTTSPTEANSPVFGTNGLLTVSQGGSVLDTDLLNHANNQINSLSGVSKANNSAAVQSALDRALAAIRDGYNALILEP